MLRYAAIAGVMMIGLVSFAEGQNTAQNLIIKDSPLDVAQTTIKLEETIKAHGGRVISIMDHGHSHAGETGVGTPHDEPHIIIFSDPKLDQDLMRENVLAGISLPFKIIIWDEEGKTKMAYVRPENIAREFGISPGHTTVMAMSDRLNEITRAMRDEIPVNLVAAK